MRTPFDPRDPHAGQPVVAHGPKPTDARLTMILVHGRGASADDIIGLTQELQFDDVACLAPQAAGNTWYPYSFLAPIEQNEPGISSAIHVLSRLLESLDAQGVGSERIALLGFSQGACLALEFAARHARRYAGVFALSGGLIGPPGTPRNYPGTFDGTPPDVMSAATASRRMCRPCSEHSSVDGPAAATDQHKCAGDEHVQSCQLCIRAACDEIENQRGDNRGGKEECRKARQGADCQQASTNQLNAGSDGREEHGKREPHGYRVLKQGPGRAGRKVAPAARNFMPAVERCDRDAGRHA
jgi:hypothetical protein